MTSMRIGQVAERAGVTVETIRFYESQALISEPPRSQGGYRLYTADAVKRVRFIQRAKELGFSLNDIQSLLKLRNEPGTTCAVIRVQTVKKIAEVEDKIRDLTRIRNALSNLADRCVSDANLSECPILDALDDDC